MGLHFNLVGMFGLCMVTMLWQAAWGNSWLIAFALCCLWLCWCWRKHKSLVPDAILLTAFLMNLWYVLGSWGNVRQHDYFNFFMHADYFIRHDFFLSRPIDYLQEAYFQPPLWGLICALITKLMMVLGYSKELGFDFVRFISLFAVSGCGIIFWRIIKLFDIRENIRLGIFTLFVFLPINGIMANLVNNDTMVYFLMMLVIYQTFLWFENGSWRQVFYISGLLFLGAMIKFSALMLMPALGILGLYKLIKSPNKLSSKLWGQFFVVGVSAVLGFSWGILLLYHGLPLTPPPLNNEYQSIAQYGFFEKMFITDMVAVPFADVRAGQLEPNVWISLIKTSLFGEWTWKSLFLGYVLYALGIILAVAVVGSFIFLFRKKFADNVAYNIFFVVLVISVLGAWGNFWIDYPYFCSTEFRYVIILLPMSMLWLAFYLQNKSLPNVLNYTLAGGVFLMIFARFMLYLYTI